MVKRTAASAGADDMIKKAKTEALERVAATVKKWTDDHPTPESRQSKIATAKEERPAIATRRSPRKPAPSSRNDDDVVKATTRKSPKKAVALFNDEDDMVPRTRRQTLKFDNPTKPDITKKKAKVAKAVEVNSPEEKPRASSPEKVIMAAALVKEESIVASSAQSNTPAVEEEENVENALVSLWDHFWGSLNTIFQTITPVYIGIVLALSGVVQWFGPNSSIGQTASLASVIISLVFAVCLALFLTVLFPCILLMRAADQAIFSSGGNMLKSSALELGSVGFIALVYLLFYQYVALKVAEQQPDATNAEL